MNDTTISQADPPVPGARARLVADEALGTVIDTAITAVVAWRATTPSSATRDALARARADLLDTLARSPRADHAKALWDATGADAPDYAAEIEALLNALDAAADAEVAMNGADCLVVLHVVQKTGISYELSWQHTRTVGQNGIIALAEGMARKHPNAVTRWWITDREGAVTHDEFEPLRRSGKPFAEITLTHEDREFTYLLPAHFEVCGRCQGHGTHLTPSIGLHAYSEEEFAEEFADEEDRAAYFQRGGKYDMECERCEGRRVVPEVDPATLNARQKRVYAAWAAAERDRRADARMRAAERAMGA